MKIDQEQLFCNNFRKGCILISLILITVFLQKDHKISGSSMGKILYCGNYNVDLFASAVL